MGYVHIDDVALCLILLYENKASHGRYLCSSTVMDNDELVAMLATRYPGFPIPKRLVRQYLTIEYVKLIVVGIQISCCSLFTQF
jgi:nucleoside-diphosphate-sugar epimerase